MQNGKHSKPDLRTERWGYGPGGEEYVCIEFEIPDDQALLSDFDVWHIVLCNGLIAESEEEDNRQDTYYDSLTPEEQKAYKDKNWERVFDITPLNNHWIKRGSWVQATKAKDLGFRVLQFNAVVESNTHARHLYERLGFVQLGTIPGGFRMKDGHYENICPYYHTLND